MRSCIASYVKFILLKEKKTHFRENWLILLRIWGEAELLLGILGAKAKYFRRAEDLFRDLWIPSALLLESKGAQIPLGPHLYTILSQFGDRIRNFIGSLPYIDTLRPVKGDKTLYAILNKHVLHITVSIVSLWSLRRHCATEIGTQDLRD